MVFIGSKKDLSSISDDFKNVWIIFIREFNHSFPKREIQPSELQRRIKLLQERITILKNEAAKRVEESVGEKALEEYTNNLTSLIGSLENLSNEFKKIYNILSINKPVSHKYLKHALTTIVTNIKEIKALIKLIGKSYINLKRRYFFKKSAAISAKTIIALLISGSGITASLHYGLTYLARNLPKKKEGLAILISYYTKGIGDAWLRRNAELFIPMYIARVELAFGQKADIVKKAATKEDFFKVIRDDSIQNIVLFGHGSWDSWIATPADPSDEFEVVSAIVRSSELNAFPQRKKGILVRHTCGEGHRIISDIWTKVDYKTQHKIDSYISELQKSLGPDYSIQMRDVNHPNHIPPKYSPLILSIERHSNKEIITMNFGYWSQYKDAFEFYINDVREIFKEKPALKLFDEFVDFLKNLIKEKGKKFNVREGSSPLGTPVFKRNNIKGWDRIASPWDFMINVFGQKENKIDKLYAMK